MSGGLCWQRSNPEPTAFSWPEPASTVSSCDAGSPLLLSHRRGDLFSVRRPRERVSENGFCMVVWSASAPLAGSVNVRDHQHAGVFDIVLPDVGEPLSVRRKRDRAITSKINWRGVPPSEGT